MKNNLFIPISFLFALVFMASCDNEDDNQGAGTLEATEGVNISIDLPFGSNTTLVEQNTTYEFTVNISEPQIVDIKLTVAQTAGNATAGSDFIIPSSVVIPAYATSATGEISILEDNEAEGPESVTVTVGNERTANASFNPASFTFNINNLTNGDLSADLSWSATAFKIDGTEYAPTEIADLVLQLTDVPFENVINESDGSGFESLTLTSEATDEENPATPDGEYYLVASFFDAIEDPIAVSLELTFNQIGVINDQTFTFEDALNTGNSCASSYFIMAKVTKTGENYTIEEIGKQSETSVASFNGNAIVVTDAWEDYEVGAEVPLAGVSDTEFRILATNNSAIDNSATAYLTVTIDPTDGSATVASNEPFNYGGTLVDVTGTGSVVECTGAIDLVLTFGDFGDFAFVLAKSE